MKKISRVVLLFIFVVAAAFLLTACVDSFGRPSDYVEVDRLTIEKANIYLSPSGETSTYQLNINILPEDATNQKLTYYIPGEYLQYLRVSSTGLLSATGQTVPDDTVIPVTVYSTTNKNARLVLNVVIEYVAVKDISFDEDKITLLYNGDGYQVSPIFTPSHAQDGRTVSYRSLNSSVASVDSSGFVRPLTAGFTHILCETTTTSGKQITGRLEVEVVYTEGRYRLEVSDSNPQYNQVLGDFKAINFNLMSLDPHSDPDIRILWFVDDKRVESLGLDSRQYEHIPNVEARTTYKIKVEITSNNEGADKEPKVLYSEPITIYAKFQGFGITYENLSTSLSDGYQYGDTATFVLTEGQSSVVGYRWYLKRKSDLSDGKYIAYTPSNDRNLTRTLNAEGDFVLTAKGVDSTGGVATTKEFNFSVTKLSAGDTLIALPYLFEYGAPPEVYNYFLSECDDEGNIIGATQAIGHSADGEKFFYTLNSPGYYVLTVNATLNGTIATVTTKTDGKDAETEFLYASSPIRVFSPDSGRTDFADGLIQNDELGDELNESLCLVSDVVVSGIYDGKNYRVLIDWDAPITCDDFTIEINNGSDTLLYCSSNDSFDHNAFIVPADDLTLDDSFSVRIKADGSLFTETYYYNVAGAPEETSFARINQSLYQYLTPVTENTTRYLRSMTRLGDLLTYVTFYSAESSGITVGMETIDDVLYKSFSFFIYLDIDEAELDYYHNSAIPENIPEALRDIYRAVLGAQLTFCANSNCRFDFGTASDGSGGYRVVVYIPDKTEIKTDSVAEKSGFVSESYSSAPYGKNKLYHAIDSAPLRTVSTSEQLFLAISDGYKPSFASDETRTLYQKALDIIDSIIGEDMTDAEKITAIFDYLALNVSYDHDLAELAAISPADFYSHPGYLLEGVFNNNKAVCDGISKAFLVLCGIEGIDCQHVIGTVDNNGHAWNKVRIDGVYYVVDCTNGILHADDNAVPNRKYLLVSDETYASYFTSVSVRGKYPSSDADYPVNYVVADTDDLARILNGLGEKQSDYVITIFSQISLEEITDYIVTFPSPNNNVFSSALATTESENGQFIALIFNRT